MLAPLAVLHPPGDYVSDQLRATGDYFEAAILDYLLRTLHRRGTIVDVGAHIGNHSHYFATYLLHSRVVAIEPAPANLELLRANVAELGVEVRPVAASDHSGVAYLTMPEPGDYGHLLTSWSERLTEPHVRVEAQTIDQMSLANVSLLKIDVEGHEDAVLVGALQTITRDRPWLLVEDWSGPRPIGGYRLQRSWEREHQTFLYVPE